MDNEQLWNAVLGELEVSLSRANFTTWFKNTSIVSINADQAVVGVPNVFTKEWLEKKYNSDVLEALRHNLASIRHIEYRVGSFKNLEKELSEKENIKKVEEEIKEEEAKEEVKVASGDLNPKYTFENFVVGNSNKLAFAACQSVTTQLGSKYNPLFVYGGVGLGKTHLMQAVGHAIQEENKKKKVIYVTSEKFTNDFISSITDKKTNAFKEKYRKADVLLVDDMQFLAGKEQTQEEFFHTFNALYQANKQIVLASDRPPKAIPTLEERLRSRFEGGLIADIQPPDLETRIAILQRKAQIRGYSIPLEVCDLIARSIQHNIRELEGALNRILAYCELNDSQPSLDVAKNILNTLINSPRRKSFVPKHILEKVADFYDISIQELTGSKRDREIVMPRQVAMYLLREELHLSFPKIARELGKKDHTTAIHSCEKIEKELEYNEPLRHELSLIRERVYG